MSSFHLAHIVGARPNFMKVAAVHRAMGGDVRQTMVHTGQHYDALMSDVFFAQLGLEAPDINLQVGSASHAVQTAQIMMRLEPVLLERRPDLVLVYGDVNSTVAAALVCSKLGFRLGHVEAGLRSGDWSMPEEVNRRVTDVLSDLLFTPSEDGDANLAREGVPRDRVHCVGNVMIDTLVRLLPLTDGEACRGRFRLKDKFALVTLHRPSNVDNVDALLSIMKTLAHVAESVDVLLPIHPRTARRVDDAGFRPPPRLQFVDPLGYIEFLSLQCEATVVITDSGGIQEETTFLRVPCITIRENTERPITLTMGTNVLVGSDMGQLLAQVDRAVRGAWPTGQIPPLWDGRAGERIAKIVASKAHRD